MLHIWNCPTDLGCFVLGFLFVLAFSFLFAFQVGKFLLTYLHAHCFVHQLCQNAESVKSIFHFCFWFLVFLFDSLLGFHLYIDLYYPSVLACCIFSVRGLHILIIVIFKILCDNINILSESGSDASFVSRFLLYHLAGLAMFCWNPDMLCQVIGTEWHRSLVWGFM